MSRARVRGPAAPPSGSSPLVDAALAEAVGAGQDEVGPAVHADAALLLVRQLLHPAQPITARLRATPPRRPLLAALSLCATRGPGGGWGGGVAALPAHPHAGLARLGGGQLGGGPIGAPC